MTGVNELSRSSRWQTGFLLRTLAGVLGFACFSPSALAQQGPEPNGPAPGMPAQGSPGAGSPPGSITVPTEAGNVVISPGQMGQVPVYLPPPGFPAPGVDINPGLPSSSRPVTNTATANDTFDLNRSQGGPTVVYGEKNSTGIITLGEERAGTAMTVPPVHTVKPGDTLWNLCRQYYGNAYNWPRLWSYNPQLENPHWIYPGDQLRMRENGGTAAVAETATGASAGGFLDRRQMVPQGTVFLRTTGYIGDAARDTWGEVIGAREDQMLLTEGNHVYMNVRPGIDLRIGQSLTIFRTREQPEIKDARKPPGEIVAIKGTVRIDFWDPKERVARGRVMDSIDVIERGAKVGPVTRRLDVVGIRPNRVALAARVLTSIYPHVHIVKDQLVFIDRGAQDGLEPGNRLWVVRRGDSWRQTLLLPTRVARERMVIDDPRQGPVEEARYPDEDERLPDETIAELRVLRTERQSAVALVTAATREIVVGDRAVAKKGY